MESDWKLSHVGLVVRDVEKTLEYYDSLGIFTIPCRKPFLMEGKKATIKGAHIFLGELWIEVYQPVAGNTIQQQFLDAHGEGLNHVGYMVEDLERERAYLEAKGVPLAFHVKNTASYYKPVEYGNLYLELSTGRETPESAAGGLPSAEALK
jgi:catechol 2,3-dioxygenase-like lactoylglutathione lyase family enzyme